ncbi:far upstream element-binding protein 1-like isoform X2 [Phalaenopsis equestris]|uniref:far upstream element-binding protein 1-like isoform X2 n=1 Tax=Phalaenopsis equestris TaxID=78828 RepID=UPI0009E4B76F|nr:far upstream element-binding protein 1-like isoform X2 [Phalaenopsis equestris]
MAEEEVNTEIVCEKSEVFQPLKETEPEAHEKLEEVTAVASVEVSAPDSSDQKRKLGDLEPCENEEAPAKKQHIDVSDSISENPVPAEDETTVVLEAAKQEIEGGENDGSAGQTETEEPLPVEDAGASDGALISSAVDGSIGDEQPGHAGELDDAGLGQVNLEADPVSNGQISSNENFEQASVDDMQRSSPSAPHQGGFPHPGQQDSFDPSMSRKIEVPNNKVGVLIGKAGETIRHLQINSGARIQITRDGDNDPHSSSRLVELTGTLENINKAEQLIKDVIDEANAGGSPALVARGFITSQSGGEQIEIQIPSDKVGMIIGKGGETIKSLQTKTGARIQLLPQNLPNGDTSKERTVRVTGNVKQVESARELIKDVMNQVPMRSSQRSNTYNNQHSFRPPRGPAPVTQWGPRGANLTHQTTGYNHQQRGMHTPQTAQHGSYSQHQAPPRGGWEQQRPAAAPLQTAPPSSGGYGYYNHQGGGPVPNTQPSNPLSGPLSTSTPAPINYNYGQSQAPDGYGHQTPYSQPPPAQPNYGHGYSEPNLYSQQPPVGSQPGMYGQPSATPSSYGPPRGPQPGDLMYQGPPSQYPSNLPMSQPYPYGSNAPAQQAPPYGQSYSGHADGGYSQQPSTVYPQHGVQNAPGYSQAGQAAPAPYAQQVVPQSGGYSQYPSSQPTYGDQTSQANVNYGYQGGAPDAGYAANVPSAGYAVPQPASNQPVYSQPQMNPSGYYDQSMPPQSGLGGAPTAPAGYGTNVSPQPAYGGQYDATQMYGAHQ